MATVDDRTEALELRDKVWIFAQRGVLALVVFCGGIFVGYQLWGEASKLREQVEELNEKNASLVKERDTLRSKIALVERDKNQAMKQLEDTQAKAAAAQAKIEALQAPKPVAQ
jgi:septal ring factor EnvC (AmiA/AmiB activator)